MAKSRIPLFAVRGAAALAASVAAERRAREAFQKEVARIDDVLLRFMIEDAFFTAMAATNMARLRASTFHRHAIGMAA